MRILGIGLAGLASIATIMGPARADTASDGFRWLSETDEIHREGAIWNDWLGDGNDRYKSAGVTQSWVIPEIRMSQERWIEGNTSALELQVRGFIATPDNTEIGGAPGDRPFAQYAGVGAHLRTMQRPVRMGAQTFVWQETRAGVEVGYQGEPLPFFEIMEMVHGEGGVLITPTNTIDGELLANLEARRTLRIHMDLPTADLQFAPFVQGSAGMRENSARLGMDVIYGGNLAGRTWNHDPAIGTMMPGASKPKKGYQWAVWVGGDVGYVATDAMLDGGFSGDGPSVTKERVTTRFRTGFLFGYDPIAFSYTVTWLSPEFTQQPQGQLVGAITVKYRF